jgi:hypothetical protein
LGDHLALIIGFSSANDRPTGLSPGRAMVSLRPAAGEQPSGVEMSGSGKSGVELGEKPRLADIEDLGRISSRRLVFDSGLVSIDDPRIVAIHQGYDDLVKIFERPATPC